MNVLINVCSVVPESWLSIVIGYLFNYVNEFLIDILTEDYLLNYTFPFLFHYLQSIFQRGFGHWQAPAG